jgi:hypothetical protein
MNTVSFINRGLIDLRAVRTFGVSAKECDNPIGFFGTGLKYAIAICLRLGCTVTLFRGLERFEFSTSGISMRGADFKVVTMNGEELGFTIDLGRTWEAWQAFRELYCNTLDEGGSVHDGEVDPAEEHTALVVSGAPFHAAYLQRNQIVLSAPPAFTTANVEIHLRHSPHAYYRGIRAGQLERHSALTYNIKSSMELTEDRSIKNIYVFHNEVKDAVLTTDSADFIRAFLRAPEDSLEAALDLDTWTSPSETFLQTVEAIGFRLITNNSTLKVYKKHRKVLLAPDATPLNKIEQMQLDRALKFCGRIGYNIPEYPVVVTADLGERVWGRAYEGKIYVNRSAFSVGTKIVAGTLIEEYIHLRHDLRDESRALQDHLLNALVGMGELAIGEPL